MRFLVRSTLVIWGSIGLVAMAIYSPQPDKMPPESAFILLITNRYSNNHYGPSGYLRSEIWVMDETGNPRKLIFQTEESVLRFFPNRRVANRLDFLGYSDTDQIIIYQQTWPAPQIQRQVAYSYIAVNSPNHHLMFIDYNQNLVNQNGDFLLPDYAVIELYSLSPDGQYALLHGHPKTANLPSLYLANLANQTATPIDLSTNEIIWLASDWWVAIESIDRTDNRLIRIRPDGSQRSTLYDFTNVMADTIWESPDSQWVMFENWFQSPWGITLIQVETKEIRHLIEDSPSGIGTFTSWKLLGWSPDGRWIYHLVNDGRQTILYRLAPTAPSNTLGQPLITLPVYNFYDFSWLTFNRESWPRRLWGLVYGGCFVCGLMLGLVPALQQRRT